MARPERLDDFLMLFLWFLGASSGAKEANMGPTWAPSWNTNRTKTDAKIDAKNDASCSSILVDVFWIWGANLVPKWRQVGSPKRIDVGNTENKKPPGCSQGSFL